VLALVVLIVLPPAALAESPSLDQYVERVPTAHGDEPPGTAPPGRAVHLPPGVQRQIDRGGGADAKQLEAVAGSPSLGAPPTGAGARAGGAGGSAEATGGAAPAATPGVVGAATGAATGSGAGRWLVGGLLLVTAVAAGTALARRRRAAS
jgi:hypothetical protein